MTLGENWLDQTVSDWRFPPSVARAEQSPWTCPNVLDNGAALVTVKIEAIGDQQTLTATYSDGSVISQTPTGETT